jgi:BolA protein
MSRRQEIESRLAQAIDPTHLEVIDESHMHNVPQGAESHFRVRVVSGSFEGQRLLQRHRTINRLLDETLAAGVHALALETLTPQEWQQRGGEGAESPACLGGDGSVT